MNDISPLTLLPNHVNGKHIYLYRWLDGRGWSIDVDGNHFEGSLNSIVSECVNYFKDYERILECYGYGLRGSKEKIIQKVERNYFY